MEAVQKFKACKQQRRSIQDFMQELGLLMGQASINENFTRHLLEWAVDYGILQDMLKGNMKSDTFVELDEAIIHYGMA